MSLALLALSFSLIAAVMVTDTPQRDSSTLYFLATVPALAVVFISIWPRGKRRVSK